MIPTTPSHSLPKIIALSTLLYRWLLSLGPEAFRRDYAIPALQDFRQCCRDAYQEQGSFGVLRLCPGLLGETVIGLLAEYLTEIFGRKRPMLSTIRRSMIAAFWAFVLFMLAYTALGRTADPIAPFDAIGRVHSEIAIAYTIIAYSGEIALLAVVLGGLPILLVALKHAVSSAGPRGVLRLFAIRPKQAFMLLGVALLISVCFLGYLLGTEAIFGLPSCTASSGCLAGQPLLVLVGGFAAIIAVITLIVFVILLITSSLSLAVLRTEFGTGMLRFALVPIAILALVMAAATLATATWMIRLWIVAPQFAASGVGLGNGQTAWVIAIIAAMALSTIVTTEAFRSGLRASQLRAS